MNESKNRPSKLWALVSILTGGILLLSGVGFAFNNLGIPAEIIGENLLGIELGETAAMFLGLIVGGLALFHGLSSLLNLRSSSLRLPPLYFFAILFGLALGVGNLLLNSAIPSTFLFPLAFLLGAALPTFGVIAWTGKRLGWPVSFRQASLALASGSTLSIAVTIFLGGFLFYLIYLLVIPLEFLAYSFADLFSTPGTGFIERLFFSPVLLVFLLVTALEAPFPEEFSKALTIPLFGRLRINSERKAFMLGVCSGAGFAILENMLYEGVFAQWGGWTWGGVTALRGIGSVLHPLGTGIVALGWYRSKQQGWKVLAKAYLLAVGLHTLWNGGFQPLLYLTGLENFGGIDLSLTLYGEAFEIVLLVYLSLLSLGLWWVLLRTTASIASDVPSKYSSFTLSRKQLALWALASAAVIIPIGAALGPAWPSIKEVILAGIVR